MHSEIFIHKQAELDSRTYLTVHRNCTAAAHVCDFLKADRLRDRATPSELHLWEALKDRQLGVEFHHQYRLLRYVVDFYCPEKMLVIEVDGPYHKYHHIQDSKRTAILKAYGAYVMRFRNEIVDQDVSGVVSRIMGVLANR